MFIFTFSKKWNAFQFSTLAKLIFITTATSLTPLQGCPQLIYWPRESVKTPVQNFEIFGMFFWVSIIRSKRYKMLSRDFIHATWPPAHDLASNNFGQSLDLDPTTFKLGDKLDIKLEIKFRFRTSQKIRHILQFLY